MCARTKKRKKFNPAGELYDWRGKAVFSDTQKLKARMSRLKTALAAIHSSQTDSPSLTGPAFALLSHGIHLMIDMRGTSDRLLDKLAKEGVCRPAKVLRVWIQKLAEVIDRVNPRPPPPEGMSHVLAWTADNADFHLFQNVVSVVPVGNILLAVESKEDTAHFNENFMPGMGKIADVEPDDLIATKEEDKFAQDVIDNQNILALLTATEGYKWLRSSSDPNRSSPPTRPPDGSKIAFNFRSETREGTVEKTSPNVATVNFSDGGRMKTVSVPLHDIVSTCAPSAPAPQNETPQDTEDTPTSEMFGGERHRFDESTTSIVGVLTGLSSKNNETARQVIQEIIGKYGEEEFLKAVHVIVADQEFMPTMQHEFFSRLGGENELPILPALAIGHAMKGLSVSMMSYYKCFFDPMLKSLGIKEGSPEYKRYYSGKVIRKTNDLVTNTVEMLAAAAARKYLDEAGNEQRIEVAQGELLSPNSIINAYLDFQDGEQQDKSAHSVIAMDQNMRPVRIIVTDQLKCVAQDFQKWLKGQWGTEGRTEVGPSGFERTQGGPQLADTVQENQSQEIEQDERYDAICQIKYADDGEVPGLLTRCTNAGILTKSCRKDKDTLRKKLYLLEVKNDKEAAIKFGPSRKIPKGTNSTALTLYDLLFGVERFALVQGHLLTRVRPEEKEYKHGERYPQDWLVFFKALAVSTFMRWQPNYQRLSLSFLIQLTMILKHGDPRCTDLALKRIRATFAVSEWGDSHKCIPVDLLQEHTIVEVTKQVGRRDPTSYRNLESRVILQSYLRMHEVHSRSEMNTVFDLVAPTRAARVRRERRTSRSIALVWVDIIDSVRPLVPDADSSEYERLQGFGDDQSMLLFACRSRSCYRTIDSVDHIRVTASAFKKGLVEGCEVAIPTRPYPILRCLSRHGPKKKSVERLSLASHSEQSKSNAVQSLTDDKHVIVPASSSLLDGITKAGEGKAGIYPVVLSAMSDNKVFQSDESQVGDGPSKPVILTRTKGDAVKAVVNRAQRDEKIAPIHRYVDFAKDLRCFFPRRGGGHKNTVIELARDMICEAVNKYYSPSIELIVLTMDVAECMTILRVIPHAKRGKMDGTNITHGSLSRVTKGTDDLTQYGARSDLLTCGDQNFIKLLFDTICNQAKSLEKGEWALHRAVVPFALVVAGGSAQACVAVGIGGKTHVRLNSESISVSLSDVEDEFETRQIVKSEEGEMMVYTAMAAMFGLGFTHNNFDEGIDSVSVIHSDDSDAFAGISMQFVYNLESTCTKKYRSFRGAILLHGPNKSAPQITKLGNIFTTNMEVDRDLCPTGRGFEFMVDLLAVYYRLEQDESLQVLPRGHRAISAVSAIYTATNNDYIKMASHGLTYKHLAKTLRSSSYKDAVKEHLPLDVSPVKFSQKAVLMGQHHGSDTGYNLLGMLLLLHHAFINRPATKKVLMLMYKNAAELSDGSLSYDTVRAAAMLAGELLPVPDPIALMAHLSCANLILRRVLLY